MCSGTLSETPTRLKNNNNNHNKIRFWHGYGWIPADATPAVPCSPDRPGFRLALSGPVFASAASYDQAAALKCSFQMFFLKKILWLLFMSGYSVSGPVMQVFTYITVPVVAILIVNVNITGTTRHKIFRHFDVRKKSMVLQLNSKTAKNSCMLCGWPSLTLCKTSCLSWLETRAST